MPQQVYDEPGSQYEQEDPADVGYDGRAVGDPTDPRGDLLKTPTGYRDPVQESLQRQRRKPGAEEDEDGKPRDDNSELRKGLRDHEDRAGSDSSKTKGTSEASPEDLEDEENNADFYTEKDERLKRDRFRDFLKRHKRKIAIGSGIGVAVAGGGIGLFTLLLPLKIEHIVDNLEGTFFATATDAITQESSMMLKNYLLTRVLPGYNTCGNTIKKGCTALKFGSNPVSNVYRSWADARIENKLAAKGIYFEHRPLSNEWTLHGPGVGKDGVRMGKDGDGWTKTYRNSSAFRAAQVDLVKSETRWYQTMFRFQVGGLSDRKYRTERHIIFDGKRNALGDKIENKKLAAKLYLVSRVITPHNEILGVALTCLIQGPDCHATDNQPSGDESNNGSPMSEYDKDTLNALEKVAGRKLETETAEKMLKTYTDIQDVGFQKYLITKALTPFIGEVAAGAAGDVIPIAGWINLAAQIVNGANNAGPNLVKFRYVTNGATAVSLYMMYRTMADEVHTGGDDQAEIGSFTRSLGPGNQGTSTDPAVGGTASAEQTPLYASVVEGKPVASASASAPATLSLGSVIQGKAYADSPSSGSSYLCNNGAPVPFGQVLCPEEILAGGLGITNTVHNFLNLPGVNVITVLAKGWQDTVGQLFKVGGDLVGGAIEIALKPLDLPCGIPIVKDGDPWCQLKDLANQYIPVIVDGVTQALIPDPFSTAMSGGRIFDMMAGGADVLGNAFSHTVLGAQSLTSAQFSEIVKNQKELDQQVFDQKSVATRMFDTNDQNSLVSKVAMEMPASAGGIAQGGMATLLNPLGALNHGFSSIFSGRAAAAEPLADDPFGVTRYGYPQGTVPGDPEKYWDEHCSDNAANAYQKDNSWNEAASGEANADPNTGDPLNKTTNPCLLIKAAAGATGGFFDTDNLPKQDVDGVLGGGGDSGGGGVPSSPSGSLPQGSASELAKQLVPYVNSGKIQCVFSPGCPDIINTANGKSIRAGSCQVDALNPGILGLLLGLVKAGHTFILSALCSDHSTVDGLREHNGGRAADFNTIDGVFMGPSETTPWTSQKIDVGGKLDQDALTLVGRKNIEFGQIQCHKIFSFQSDPPDYPDYCHHQHIAVEN